MANMHDEIFSGTTFSSLLKDIYENSSKKKKQIEILINELRPLIKDVSQATMVVPLIKEYLEVGVKNDEQLVKMASVYQKYVSADEKIQNLQSESGTLLTDEEKKQLLSDIKQDVAKTTTDIVRTDVDVNDFVNAIEEKSEKVIEDIKKQESEKN